MTLRDYIRNIGVKYCNNLKLAHINAQSLNDTAHYSEFCDVFSSGSIDVIGVSETFYKDTSQIELENYKVLNINRKGRNGGGVAVYVRNGLNAKLLSTSDGELGKPEYIICEISLPASKILYACIYRPPHIGFMDTFLNELDLYLPRYKYTVVCGDVNGRFGTEEHETKIIESILFQCNLTKISYGPTYHTTYSDSNLDMIASNCHDLLVDFGQTEATAFSGHDLLYAVFNFSTPIFQPKVITYRDYKNVNTEILYEYANELPWDNIYEECDINSKIEMFGNNMINVFEKCVPLKTIKIKSKRQPWMTKEIMRLIKRRNKLRKRWLLFHDPEVHEMFISVRNEIKRKIKKAKVNHYNILFGDCDNAKDMWKTVKNLGVGKQNCDLELTVPVNDLNKHYTSVSTVKYPEKVEMSIKKYSTEMNVHYDDRFYFKYVTPLEITNAITSIKSSAVGVDNLSVQFIKLCLPVVLPVIEHLFNYSLQNSCYPKIWKQANIKPIPKMKNPTVCKDFRPVSILCVLSKALEKLVHEQIFNFVNSHNFLPEFQSGFRKGHSTTTALIKVLDDIRRSADMRLLNLMLLLDMSKAFDCVHHTLLLKKLEQLYFSPSAVNWFQSYLYERQCRVFVNNNVKSDWSTLETGVPQGSVLGPLLFGLYLFDLPEVLKNCRYHQYADDLQLYYEFNPTLYGDACQKVTEDVLHVIEYMKAHNLILNVDKTQVIVIGSCPYVKRLYSCDSGLSIEIDGVTLSCKTSVLNLGVLIDSTLTWNDHCSFVINKVYSILSQLRRNFSYTPLHIRKLLVQTLIFPYFTYVLPLFTNISAVNMLKLQRAQNACVRYICNVSKFQHISPYYQTIGISKLEVMRAMLVCTITWKAINSTTPVYISKYFKKDLLKRSTRTEEGILIVPTPRTEMFKNSFHIMAATLYNKYFLFKFKTLYALKKHLRSVLN